MRDLETSFTQTVKIDKDGTWEYRESKELNEAHRRPEVEPFTIRRRSHGGGWDDGSSSFGDRGGF